MRRLGLAALVAAAVSGLPERGHATPVPPNAPLGSCLDQDWVEAIEAALSISGGERHEPDGGKLHPFLHVALPQPRFWIHDWRTNRAMDELYQPSCLQVGEAFFGVGSTLDSAGAVDSPGRANGSLILELHPYSSIRLSTMLFAILAQELLGYEIAFLKVSTKARTAERMSSRGAGVCSPVHVVMEVRSDGEADTFTPFLNETYSSASIGYYGRGGLFTTTQFVADGQTASLPNETFSADFWRDYRDSEALINSLPVSRLKNDANFYPPAYSGCADRVLGCEDSCTWTKACADRMVNGSECLLVVMFEAVFDPGYLAAVLSNLDIPAYLCYLGVGSAGTYIQSLVMSSTPVVFYYYEPELMTVLLDGMLTRVALPPSSPRRSAENTGTFGEDGAGTPTRNPVAVDFPYVQLDKYSSTTIMQSPPAESLLNRISLSALHVDQLMRRYVSHRSVPSTAPHAAFHAACDWLRVPNNYPVWSRWLNALPDCTVLDNVGYSIDGCANDDKEAARTINFHWKIPDPRDTTQPYDCDGALTSLPPPIKTSRSCEWLESYYTRWIGWIKTKPACTDEHYSYRVTKCHSDTSKRTVEFYWLLPSSSDAAVSSECTGGVQLPATVQLECEYVMYNGAAFTAVLVIVLLLVCLLALCAVYVTYYRNVPIIKRSQYQFLLSMIAGGMLMCCAIAAYAGPPHAFTCASRSVLLSYAFTLIFGSLVVKSLRVYRVFMKSAMKRVVLSATAMFKILFLFLLVDSVLLVAWFTVDPVAPLSLSTQATTLSGLVTVDVQVCTSSSFIFSALLIFWKAMLLFSGLYLSFLIRKVSTDFQESTWIFSSSLVVLFSSIIMLGLAYLVKLAPTAFYLFFAFMLLSSTVIVMALMLVPKLLRHRENASDRTTIETTSAGESSSTEMKGIIPDGAAAKMSSEGNDKRPGYMTRKLSKAMMPAKVRVTPVEAFSSKPSTSSKSSGASASSKRQQSSALEE